MNPAAVAALFSSAAPPLATRDWPSLETVLCDREYFGLTTASPTQRAICRVIDGELLGELAEDPQVIAALGGPDAIPPETRPGEIVILAAIRSGKSLLSAAAAVHATQTCDVSRLGPGEIPRIPIVSLRMDLAQVVFRHLLGGVTASAHLRRLLVGRPTADALQLRHPSGRAIEIKVTAGARAGGTLVARWLAGCIFDEAPRMLGEADGVVNLEEQRNAILGRLLPGAQILYPGSPYAPFGPIYDMVQEHFGKPSAARVVLRGTGPMLHPGYWTPERCEELRVRDPDAARTDVDGEFRSPAANMYGEESVKAAQRTSPEPAPYLPGHHYVATIDPATRGNAWTLVIGACTGQTDGIRRFSVAFARQWIGSKTSPLSPSAVLGEIAALCAPYRVRVCYTDQYAADALRELGHLHQVSLVEKTWTAGNKLDAFERLGVLLVSGLLDLPPVPELARDLLSVRKRVTATGVAVELPHTPDGRHCDYAPALAMLLSAPLALPAEPVGQPDRGAAWIDRLRQRAEDTGRDRPDWFVNREDIGL